MLNTVVLIGFVSRPPRRFGDVFSFPLAVYRDPDRDDGRKAEAQRDIPDFPPVVVVVEKVQELPGYVRHRAPIRVEGWLRTRNRTEPLSRRVRKDLIKAGLEECKADSIAALIPSELLSKTVEIEVVAERILPEGARKEEP